MSWREKMSDLDREHLRSIGIIPREIEPSGWQLVWRFGGKDEILTRNNVPYRHCVAIRKRKEKLSQYRSGKFLILPVYD